MPCIGDIRAEATHLRDQLRVHTRTVAAAPTTSYCPGYWVTACFLLQTHASGNYMGPCERASTEVVRTACFSFFFGVFVRSCIIHTEVFFFRVNIPGTAVLLLGRVRIVELSNFEPCRVYPWYLQSPTSTFIRTSVVVLQIRTSTYLTDRTRCLYVMPHLYWYQDLSTQQGRTDAAYTTNSRTFSSENCVDNFTHDI